MDSQSPPLERIIVPTSDRIMHAGKPYIKIQLLKSRVEMISGFSKRRANLWLVIPEMTPFPANPVIITEYI